MWRNRSKRSRNTQLCEECEETEIDLDDYDSISFPCGECQRMMCESCCEENSGCAICDENDKCDKDVACCESCMAYCDEEDCENIHFHESCLAEHLKNCTKKSRAQRLLSTAIQTISTTESDLTEAMSQLVRIQSRIESLKGTLAEAKEAKISAELESKAEAEK